MNTKVIQTSQDIEAVARRILADSEAPGFRLKPAKSGDWDIVAEVEVDGALHRFGVECKLRPTQREVEKLASKRTGGLTPLLITVQATESLVHNCQRFGVSCLDLNGRIWLRAKGILVDRMGGNRLVQYRTAELPANLFSLKGSRLSRVLLSFPGRQWRQGELAELSGLSQGLLSRLLKHASTEGWVEGSRGDWTLTDAERLLDAWKDADVWRKRVRVRQYSALEGDPSRLARRVMDSLTGEVAFTQWFAAKLRFPYTDVPIVSVYTDETPDAKFEDALRIREVSSGGKLWLITPRDAGVFQATRQVDDFPIVCDVQIYLDLLQVGLRGPDQAEAMRSWEGFRKP